MKNFYTIIECVNCKDMIEFTDEKEANEFKKNKICNVCLKNLEKRKR